MYCADRLRLLTAYGNAVTLAANAKAQFQTTEVQCEEYFITLIVAMSDAASACQSAQEAVNRHISEHRCLAAAPHLTITADSGDPSLMRGRLLALNAKPLPRDPEPDDPDPETPGPNPDEEGPDVDDPDIDPDQNPIPLKLIYNVSHGRGPLLRAKP
jgi:hypothetical protein